MCEVTSWQGVLLALWACLEFWLGRTDKLEAGSTLELVLNILRLILSYFGINLPFGKKQGGKR